MVANGTSQIESGENSLQASTILPVNKNKDKKIGERLISAPKNSKEANTGIGLPFVINNSKFY